MRSVLRLGLFVGLFLILTSACRPGYVEVPRAAGGTVRLRKARLPLSFMRKLDVSFGRYFLLRRNAEFAAVRLSRRAGGGAFWDCSYEGDGSGDLIHGQIAYGELFESRTPTETPGIYSTEGEITNVVCGPLVVGWSTGNWLYPRGLWSGSDAAKHQHDLGVELATTWATSLDGVNVFADELDWLAPW